jgi:hypothetical protein
VSCDLDFRKAEGRIDDGGWTIRDALPNIPSRRSGRRRKSSCLNRLTAWTCVELAYACRVDGRTYDCDEMAHVPGNGRVDFFVSGWFYYDGNVLRLW